MRLGGGGDDDDKRRLAAPNSALDEDANAPNVGRGGEAAALAKRRRRAIFSVLGIVICALIAIILLTLVLMLRFSSYDPLRIRETISTAMVRQKNRKEINWHTIDFFTENLRLASVLVVSPSYKFGLDTTAARCCRCLRRAQAAALNACGSRGGRTKRAPSTCAFFMRATFRFSTFRRC